MEFRVDKNKIKHGLKKIQSIVQSPRSLALSYTLLEVRDNQLIIKATDAEVYWKEVIPCESSHNGDVCVSARLIFEIVNRLPDGTVTAHYEPSKNRLNLNSNKSHFELACLSKKDFHPFPEEKSMETLRITASEMAQLLRETSFAINTGSQGMRFHFNGLLLEVNEGILRAVATNNHRLSISKISSGGGNFPPSIVPRKAVNALQELLSEVRSKEVEIDFLPNREQNKSITFRTGQVTLITKLISGTFQSLDDTIDKVVNKCTPISMSSLTLDEVVSRVSTVSNQSHKAIQIEITPDLARIEACSSTNDTAKEEIKIESAVEGKISLNAKYLLEVTRTLEGNLKIWIPSCQKDSEVHGLPVVIRGEKSPSTHVIMPLRDK